MTADSLRVDWQRLILTLRGLGMTETEIARRIRSPRTALVAWKNGTEPLHVTGERLILLYCSELSLTREDIPVRRVP